MLISSLLAAVMTFTATATGVEKGTAIEFVFAGKNSDRDYESMFLLDESIDSFCKRLEAAGVTRGLPVEQISCRLWPVGAVLTFEPSLDQFIAGKLAGSNQSAVPIYTGGTRASDGSCIATDEMPASVFSIYTLAQSPIVFNGLFEQGAVYGSLTAAVKLEKGRRYSFSVSCDPKTFPKKLCLTVSRDNATEIIKALRDASATGEVDACIGFDGEMTVSEATSVAQALSTIDSTRVKINGSSNIFYRAFQPLVKWLDRNERLQQPFELTIDDDLDKLVFIDEDWSVEGNDPKLTPRQIDFSDVSKHPKTDTCFIFAKPTEKVSRILLAMKPILGTQVRNWYVFSR